MEILVEAGFDNARDVFDVKASFGDDVVPGWAYAGARGHAKQLSFMVVDRERKALQALLEQAIADGATARDFAADIRDFFAAGYHILAPADVHGFGGTDVIRVTPTKSWSMTVARTELSRAANLGSVAFYHTAKIAKIQWIAADSPTTCPECEDADEHVVNLGETFPFVDVEQPPAHPCAPAGTRILLARGIVPIEQVVVGDLAMTHTGAFRAVREVMQREVSEELVELRVAGRVLRVTGNHPIRTPKGWTPSQALQPGDEVCCVSPEAMIGAPFETHDVPASSMERVDLYDVLGALAFAAVPIPAIDLDREPTVGERNIDAENVERVVRDGGEAEVEQRRQHDALVAALDPIGGRLGALSALSLGSYSAAHGVVSGVREALALLGAGRLHPERLGVGKPAPRQSETPEAAGDRVAPISAPKFDREGEHRLASEMARVQRSNLFIGQGASFRLQSRHIQRVRIDSATRLAHGGMVYNFSVDRDESYVAEGIVVHNCCACGLIPADEDLGDFAGTDEQRDTAARGGYSAEDYEAKFGEKHPVDK